MLRFTDYLTIFDTIFRGMLVMKRSLYCFCFLLFSVFCFSQQTEEFREVKNFYDQHQLKVNEEFKRRLGLVRNFEEKIKLESEYGFFIKKQRRLLKNIIFLISISRTSLRNWNKPIFLSLQQVQVSLSCILRICLKRIFWL